jgi:hypothetical protein
LTVCAFIRPSTDPDPDPRLLAAPDHVAELQPRPEPRDPRRLRHADRDQQLIRQAEIVEMMAKAKPILPALAGPQRLHRLTRATAILLAARLALLFGERSFGHGCPPDGSGSRRLRDRSPNDRHVTDAVPQ